MSIQALIVVLRSFLRHLQHVRRVFCGRGGSSSRKEVLCGFDRWKGTGQNDDIANNKLGKLRQFQGEVWLLG
jgi:hypothetical protein